MKPRNTPELVAIALSTCLIILGSLNHNEQVPDISYSDAESVLAKNEALPYFSLDEAQRHLIPGLSVHVDSLLQQSQRRILESKEADDVLTLQLVKGIGPKKAKQVTTYLCFNHCTTLPVQSRIELTERSQQLPTIVDQ
jgi:hypothetical protein